MTREREKILRLLIDYDATLAQTDDLRYAWINNQFGTEYHPKNATTWLNSDSQYMEPEHDVWGWSDACFLNEDFQQMVSPVVGAIDGVRHILDKGHEAMIVSDRPKSLFEVTRNWLDKYGFDMVRLLFTTHKHSMSTDRTNMFTKMQAAYLYKLNVIIEDGPHHVLNFQDKSYIDRVFMLDYPYNQHVAKHQKVTRVKGWNQIVREIQ